jgi:hypothetical protein
MARPGFANRLRTWLGNDEFDEKLNAFLRKNAAKVCADSKVRR